MYSKADWIIRDVFECERILQFSFQVKVDWEKIEAKIESEYGKEREKANVVKR